MDYFHEGGADTSSIFYIASHHWKDWGSTVQPESNMESLLWFPGKIRGLELLQGKSPVSPTSHWSLQQSF